MSNELRGLSSLDWPVFIKYADYEELGYVVNALYWEVEVGINGVYLSPADIVIDSRGASFFIEDQGENLKVLTLTQQVIGIEEVLSWVRVHASLQGYCCVSKLHASSIGDVFTILESLDD